MKEEVLYKLKNTIYVPDYTDDIEFCFAIVPSWFTDKDTITKYTFRRETNDDNDDMLTITSQQCVNDNISDDDIICSDDQLSLPLSLTKTLTHELTKTLTHELTTKHVVVIPLIETDIQHVDTLLVKQPVATLDKLVQSLQWCDVPKHVVSIYLSLDNDGIADSTVIFNCDYMTGELQLCGNKIKDGVYTLVRGKDNSKQRYTVQTKGGYANGHFQCVDERTGEIQSGYMTRGIITEICDIGTPDFGLYD